jgi:hypothetical protein
MMDLEPIPLIRIFIQDIWDSETLQFSMLTE